MSSKAIHIDKLPKLHKPLIIVGLDGWGNALDTSKAMVTYIIRKLGAVNFAKIDSDLFYRYDESRPIVDIKDGLLKGLTPPGGDFYFAHTPGDENDLVILKANEPNLRWFHFVDEIFSLCKRLDIEMMITLGGMFDDVLHTDLFISGVASDKDLLQRMYQKKILPISYQGPSAIHSTLHSEGKKRGFRIISLWCHCPYYLQGTTHFGLLSSLGSVISFLGGFKLDTEELDLAWKQLNLQIQGLIEKKPELRTMITELRKAKVKGSLKDMRGVEKTNRKIIDLKDFFQPK